MARRRSYPHLDLIKDGPTRDTLRLLWDRIIEAEARVLEEREDLLKLGGQVAVVPRLETAQRRHESALRGLTTPVLVDPGDPSIPVPGDETPGAPGSPNPPPTPSPGSGDVPHPGSRLGVVQSVANSNPGALANSCQPPHGSGTWEFVDLVIAALRAESPRWGYNCKRGNCGDISPDVTDYYYGQDLSQAQGSTKVYIFDFIVGHCGSNPAPAWIDQTAATAAAGTIGKWKYPR